MKIYQIALRKIIPPVISALAFVGLISNSYASLSDCPKWDTQYNRLERIGEENTVVTVRHRGDFTSDIPENSLAAFRLSYENCRAAVETDVRMLNDGNLVIFHDVQIGKMLIPDYNAITDKPSNPKLAEMTLSELQNLKLVNIAGKVTDQKVPTVKEMLEDYLLYGGQSLIYLEIKDPKAIMKTAKLVTDLAIEKDDPTLLKRVIIKFYMAEYPTPMQWKEALKAEKADESIMANPMISPSAAERINKGPSIPAPPDTNFDDNASKAVTWWAATTNTFVPNVEAVIKDSSDFIETEPKSSKQGDFFAPKNISISNTKDGTMARMVAIIKSYNKPLGAFVPVPDYILWSQGAVNGLTVPSVFDDNRQFNINKAFYHNTSQCCYSLKDRLAQDEKNDYRENLAWNRSIEVNIITADDTDSIDTYFNDSGALDKIARPKPIKPSVSMNSTISWALEYVPEPTEQKVRFKIWNGKEDASWGGQVCLWDNPFTSHYAWIYRCDADWAHNDDYGYNRDLFLKVVTNDSWSPKYGELIQIYSKQKVKDGNNTNYITWCLNGNMVNTWGMHWTQDCSAQNIDTLFVRSGDVHYLSIGSRGIFYDLWDMTGDWSEWKWYYGDRYGKLIVDYIIGRGSWAEWKVDPVINPTDFVEN
ncbi:glycerophosphodiester phosphodiesterase family protein [Proteus sp. ZN5]|uniref:glycerophosphodiester phosphodiesterase family protein n=1 Tax=Proteus sp. ZN5 TaxID=2697019 RepID=UPI0013E1CB3C|nr:glycerophosphodiester phosphodiesterase family protein [Proteus sp. ZN5]QIG04916.1 hypothetical protein GTK47_06000 [Proteus sp. ZN5]